jgi:hypothetical protein
MMIKMARAAADEGVRYALRQASILRNLADRVERNGITREVLLDAVDVHPTVGQYVYKFLGLDRHKSTRADVCDAFLPLTRQPSAEAARQTDLNEPVPAPRINTTHARGRAPYDAVSEAERIIREALDREPLPVIDWSDDQLNDRERLICARIQKRIERIEAMQRAARKRPAE